MNKCRRMSALQARALALAGFDVLQFDLGGCGDSDGDFAQARWNGWLDDVVHCARWLRSLPAPGADSADDAAPLWLWGNRGGCLLAAESASVIGGSVEFLFWQPISSGATMLQQFLRLRSLGGALDEAKKESVRALRHLLAQGTPLEIAGYTLAPDLAASLQAARLTPPSAGSRAIWVEVSNQPGTTALPGTAAAAAQWRAAGFAVELVVVPGPAFWQTTEIEDAPELIRHSVTAMLAATIAWPS